jgi:hypothetical protein
MTHTRSHSRWDIATVNFLAYSSPLRWKPQILQKLRPTPAIGQPDATSQKTLPQSGPLIFILIILSLFLFYIFSTEEKPTQYFARSYNYFFSTAFHIIFLSSNIWLNLLVLGYPIGLFPYILKSMYLSVTLLLPIHFIRPMDSYPRRGSFEFRPHWGLSWLRFSWPFSTQVTGRYTY